MQKEKRVFWLLCMMIIAMLAMPLSARAATQDAYRLSGVTKPTGLKQGAVFSVRGTVTCSNPIRQICVAIYNASKTSIVQRHIATPYTKTYNLAYSDPYILFDKLQPGTYYYSIYSRGSVSVRLIVDQKFTVTGNGQMRIVNPKPAADFSINRGGTYAIGGTVVSTYRLSAVRTAVTDSNNKYVLLHTVKPNTTSYKLENSPLDSAMQFNKLPAGTYKYRVIAADAQGTVATLVYRTLTVKGTAAVTSGTTGNASATGSNTAASDKTYLNTTENVQTPAGYAARTSRPQITNPYFYNARYNIYYKYDSLAPTGKPYYGNMYVRGNCTWYACGRAMEIVARAGGNIANVQAIFGGDPVGIYEANVAKGKFKYGKTPKVGALAIFNYGSNGDTHIAVVEKVVNGVPYVSESGYTESKVAPNAQRTNIAFYYQSIYNWAGGRSLLGYIYLI